MNNIKLTSDLLIFAEVAQQLSFTSAAKQLNLSKAAVSLSISRLEKELGMQLMIRSTRKISLTPFGAKLAVSCSALNSQVNETLQDIHKEQTKPTGPLSITAPYSLETSVLLPSLKQFAEEYPDITPQLNITDAPLDLIDDNIDIALFSGTLPDSDYRALRLPPLKEQLFATPEFIEKLSIDNRLTKLGGMPWAKAPWQKETIELFQRDSRLAITPKRTSECNSLSSAIHLALHDLSFVFAPKIAVTQYLLTGKLKAIAPEYSGKEWPLYFLHGYKREKPAHISRLYDLINLHMRRSTAV
ncbi:LysR family transcriptional regulator [Kordiimonas sp. SCSIO 12603]|uniref:LysR family transcriptional regulator n=1 Tax=Kordiimonas sp. SCSIO 12603 TaxID=2829596 RepID=UPI002102D229|nr:LysR family transcriptional regulator [Kordiimonas sp. SCSIO 12603]UTW57792.1 LysR family transcriptional regulator [Kordiimonas sp. SCSIO 12603]